MVGLPQIRCQLHDHAKQYDNDGACHNKRNDGKLHGNISRNGYGNAIIGRYGGCFEEDIRMFTCERAMHGTVEVSKLQKGKSAYDPWTHISHKELIYLLQKFVSPRSKVLLHMLLGGGW